MAGYAFANPPYGLNTREPGLGWVFAFQRCHSAPASQFADRLPDRTNVLGGFPIIPAGRAPVEVDRREQVIGGSSARVRLHLVRDLVEFVDRPRIAVWAAYKRTEAFNVRPRRVFARKLVQYRAHRRNLLDWLVLRQSSAIFGAESCDRSALGSRHAEPAPPATIFSFSF